MKCLRCGWEMGDDTVKCRHCHHYYVSNLIKAPAQIFYFDSKKQKAEKEKHEADIRKRLVYFFITFVALCVVCVIANNLQNIKDFIMPPSVVNQCNLVCEDNVKSVIFHRCTCGDGKVINIP